MKKHSKYLLRAAIARAALLALAISTPAQAQSESDSSMRDDIAKIRDEGMNHSQVMDTLSYLSDVIGPRLTGSPNMKHANEWTRDKLTSYGLVNAAVEPWGYFGRGWELKRFSAQVIEPQDIPLKAFPASWSTGLDHPIEADVYYLAGATNIDEMADKLKGAIVLTSPIRELTPHFTPLGTRLTETNLLALANGSSARGGRGGQRGGRGARGGGTNNVAGARGGRGGRGGGARGPSLGTLAADGVAVVMTSSPQGDGGTIFVQSATVPPPANGGGGRGGRGNSAYSTNAPMNAPAQICVAVEDYNRMVRMIQAGEKLKMAVDLKVKFYDDDMQAYNTVAEIPGTDLKDQLVMLGGHMDSWQSGTGATDNGAGVAAAMEAVRIIKAAGLHPRRTIRIALWSGEEEGLLGSRAYVTNHFGTHDNPKPEYDKLSAYFNLDNGAGKIRGIYMQGNEAVRPIFSAWLQPFHDLGAETVTPNNTGSTDHVSFDGIGLPGFQFIQDGLEYGSRTHHSNEDVFDRVVADDMKQCSTILAAFVYHAAMMDEKVPRKPAASN